METHNNLYEGLLNSDYGIARKDKNFSIDYKSVETDLQERFGKDFIEEHFGTPGHAGRNLRKYPELEL